MYSDSFKRYSEILVRDNRWDIFGHTEASLEIFHKSIEIIQLKSSVPEQILLSFEAAKNTLLYSYFCYRLSSPATSFALSTLEMALTLKFEKNKTGLPNGLYNKLVRALELGWLDVKNIVKPRNVPTDWHEYVKTAVIPYIQLIRNDLAHEPVYLDFPQNACEHLSMIARIINMLFED